MEFFEKLGDTVAHRWKARNFDERGFPEIAATALAEFPPHENASIRDVAKWATDADSLPYQVDLAAQFGDPPLTVYLGRGFRIEVLFWLRGTPAIHQHAFSGAFHVMRGSSIHSLWDFEPTERIETRLVLGKVSFNEVEILKRGDTRMILPGNRMYHATFHLDKPSVSVVVRTISEVDTRPQYVLLPPSIAFAVDDKFPYLERQAQILAMLIHSGNRSEYRETVNRMIATKDAFTVHKILMETYNLIEDEEERHTVLAAAKIRHPRLLEALEPSLERDMARGRLLQIQRQLSNPDLKYFLALLLNIPDGNAIIRLIKDRFPLKNPVAAIIEWLRLLSATGLPGFKFQEPWLVLLECMLTERLEEPALREFHARHSKNGVNFKDEDVRTLAGALRTSWMLKPLFSNELKAGKVNSAGNNPSPVAAEAGSGAR